MESSEYPDVAQASELNLSTAQAAEWCLFKK